MTVTEIKHAAEAEGHSWATLRRAKDQMAGRVLARQTVGAAHGGWRWDLLDPEKELYKAPAVPW
jgi:hypothetical protein